MTKYEIKTRDKNISNIDLPLFNLQWLKDSTLILSSSFSLYYNFIIVYNSN